MSKFQFNANEVEPASFEAIPAGKYEAVITKAEMKDTQAGDGEYLELTFQVIEGEHKNRLLWGRLNIVNKSEQAVKIARGQLSAICRAVGVAELNESNLPNLYDKPLIIRVSQREFEGEMRNEIKGYATRDPDSIPGSTAAAPSAAAGPGKTIPWKR